MHDRENTNESLGNALVKGVLTDISRRIQMNPAAVFFAMSRREILSSLAAFLVTVALYFWFTRYKLRYLLRIIVSVFAFSSFISLFLSCDWKDEPTLFEFSQKLHWSFVGWENVFAVSLLNQKSVWHVICAASPFLILFMLFVRYRWTEPLFIVKHSTSVGFGHLKRTAKRSGRTVREVAGERIRFRDPGDMNPVYVNGWIPLIESSEVTRGQVVSIVAVGYKFAVFRCEDGTISVMDAYCPHMGADLSAGGQVIGDCIECPFHGWQFCGKTGKCTKIPYSDRVLDLATAKVWESCERNNYIFVWHHAEGESPTWQIPFIPEIETGKWVYRGGSQLTVHCHIQDIPENGADIAHLPQVHSRFVFFGPDLPGRGEIGSFFYHDWQPQWAPDETEPHIARVHLVQCIKILTKYKVPFSRIEVDIEQIGPATVHMHTKTRFGRGVILQYITTEAPQQQRVVHLLYTERNFKQGPANFLIWGESVMIERDIMIWNNKKFLKNPLLVREDKLVAKFRRWYAQFYSENSPTLKDVRKKTLDW